MWQLGSLDFQAGFRIQDAGNPKPSPRSPWYTEDIKKHKKEMGRGVGCYGTLLYCMYSSSV